MSQDIQAVSAAFKVIGEAAGWQVVGAIAAAGTIAMAILQVVKELTRALERLRRVVVNREVNSAHAFKQRAEFAEDRPGRRACSGS